MTPCHIVVFVLAIIPQHIGVVVVVDDDGVGAMTPCHIVVFVLAIIPQHIGVVVVAMTPHQAHVVVVKGSSF